MSLPVLSAHHPVINIPWQDDTLEGLLGSFDITRSRLFSKSAIATEYT